MAPSSPVVAADTGLISEIAWEDGARAARRAGVMPGGAVDRSKQVGRVGVVTDSIACLSKEVRDRYGIGFASIHLILDGTDYRDGVDISADEYYARLGEIIRHTTSSPSAGEWVEEMEKVLAKGFDELLVVTLSAELSMANDAARLAAGLVSARVEVVDSGTAAAAEGLMVRRLAELAADGMSLDDLVASAGRIRDRYHFLGVLSGLARLAHSGRMPGALARIGDSLSVKPIISLERGGAVHPAGIAHGLESGVEKVYRRVLEALPPDKAARATVTHALMGEAAEKLADRLRADRPGAAVDVVVFTPVMGASTGPIIGIAWEDPER